MGAKETTEYRRRRKENLIKVCGGQCVLCGYKRLSSALEFHHINPEDKEYAVASNGTCHNLEKDLSEVKKCLLVCANCHREIHAGLFSEEDLWVKQVYLEDIAQSLREDKQVRVGEKGYFCLECGKQITKYSTSGLCSDCATKGRRLVDRPSREELKQLIRTTPFTRIASQFGVTDNAIRKWCKAENLPSKVSDIKSYSIEEWENI